MDGQGKNQRHHVKNELLDRAGVEVAHLHKRIVGRSEVLLKQPFETAKVAYVQLESKPCSLQFVIA
jgi:hypothetical protein